MRHDGGVCVSRALVFVLAFASLVGCESLSQVVVSVDADPAGASARHRFECACAMTRARSSAIEW